MGHRLRFYLLLLLRSFFGDVATRLQVPATGPPVIRYRQAPASLVRHGLAVAAITTPIISLVHLRKHHAVFLAIVAFLTVRCLRCSDPVNVLKSDCGHHIR